MKLILASSSPRRAEVLRNAGFVFEVRPAEVDETRQPHEAAEDYVRRVAQAKAQVVAEQARAAGERAIVIAADTIVLAEGQILGKPKDAEDARRMLRLFSGKTHEVLTALCVINIAMGKEALHVEKTRVEFLKISEEEIESYIQTGEPFDKAGAYGIQGIAGRFARASKAAISTCWACRSHASGPPCKRSAGKKTARRSERAERENGGPAERDRRQKTSRENLSPQISRSSAVAPLLLFFSSS